jgi:hypothetical protein
MKNKIIICSNYNPRAGFRFAMQQSKLCLVTILRNFTLKKGCKTKEPLRLDRRQFISTVDGGVWVTLAPRNEE